MRAAVIGAGVSGLVSAYVLARAGMKVVLYEKEDYLGGHARTVTVDGVPLDLGFMVFNRVSHFLTPQKIKKIKNKKLIFLFRPKFKIST